MAEQDQLDPEVGGDNGAAVKEKEEKKKKGFPFLLILIPALLLPAGGAGWLVYSRYEQVAEAAAAVSRIFGDPSDHPVVAKEEPIEYGEFHELSGLTVNPAGSGGKRFLMVKLGLEAQEAEVFEELTTKEVVVRDTVLRVLSSYTIDQLSDVSQRSQLRTDVLQAINNVMQEGEVERLYFTQYVVQ